MTDEQRIERIEAYLDKAMDEQERRDFEQEMATDEKLRKQVILQETIRLAFKNASDIPLNKQMDNLFEQNRYRFEDKLDLNDIDSDFWKAMDFESKQTTTDTPPSVLRPVVSKNRWFLLAAAASFILLLAIGWWWLAQKTVPTHQGQIVVDTEGGGSQPSKSETIPDITPKENNKTPDKPIEKQKNVQSTNEQIANDYRQTSDIIQKITILAEVEKNIAATVMSSATKQNLYEVAVKKYVGNGDTKGFEDFLKSDPKADSYQNTKRLVHACFRLKNYEKAINYCLTGLKLTDLEADEKQELKLLLLESYYGDFVKYKNMIKNIAETGSTEEKNLIKTMTSKGF